MIRKRTAPFLCLRKNWILVAVIIVSLAGCSKATDQELWNKLNTAMEQEKSNLQIKTLEIIEELAKRNNSQIKQPEFMDRFTTIVLEKIDLEGNWLAEKDERYVLMERIIKQMDSTAILTSLGKLLKEPHQYSRRSNGPLVCVPCKKTLALAEKIGINGYESYFLSIFSEIADQTMAEYFLYSKNGALSDAGKQWLEKRPNAIDNLVYNGASCLSEEADWIDIDTGRRIYNILKTVKGEVVVDSLARHVLKPEIRLRALFLGVKLGIPGTEERLNKILVNRGDKRMAEDFLNSGSQKLHDGGSEWANVHGYFISTGMGSHRVAWGQF